MAAENEVLSGKVPEAQMPEAETRDCHWLHNLFHHEHKEKIDESKDPVVDPVKRENAAAWFAKQTAEHADFSDDEKSDLNYLKQACVNGKLDDLESYFQKHKEELKADDKKPQSSAEKVVQAFVDDLDGVNDIVHKAGLLTPGAVVAQQWPRRHGFLHQLDGASDYRSISLQYVDTPWPPKRFYTFAIGADGPTLVSHGDDTYWTAREANENSDWCYEPPKRMFEWANYWLIENINKNLDQREQRK